MKVKNLVSKRYKETPADCQIASQALMMRGGYIKPVGNGIFTLFPAAKRVTAKIEKIIREETLAALDKIAAEANYSRNELINLILSHGIKNIEIEDT